MKVHLSTRKHFQIAQRLGICYLCTKPLIKGHKRSADHVPPKTIFADTDREPVLVLPTHPSCNLAQSAEDEIMGKLLGALHGKPANPKGRKLKIGTATFADGSVGLGLTDLSLKEVIFRWIRGFHAALYGVPLGASGYAVHPPLQEARFDGEKVVEVPLDPIVEKLVEEVKRNRATNSLDIIECRNGKCRYECVWAQADSGRRVCIWALDVYGWRDLGDSFHFAPRGCVGIYWQNDGHVPASATLGTKLDFDVPNADQLDAFGA